MQAKCTCTIFVCVLLFCVLVPISNIVLHWESLLLVIRKPRLTDDIAMHENVCCVCAHAQSFVCSFIRIHICCYVKFMAFVSQRNIYHLNLEIVYFMSEMLKSLIDMCLLKFHSRVVIMTGNGIIKYIFICVRLNLVEF